ncbi:RHS domain-containing protein [Jiella sp. MQZ9-1]|uniref:RHS domain-containing protein n=1 Tax=Jiella flava TaxID=2816857 RepID=A0A939JVU1_9HYPH|nr:RHS repeat-associated core domain-containing protein [Jiella flava]MBO0664565.1 RHS domain-containing protein [Jiella flava]MCD2473198.1 RHS domain-containing protein [Jiella flava]
MTGGLANRVIAETDGAGVSRREYIWLDNQVVAVIDDANTTNPTPYWVTNDNLGRPVQMTDADRAVVWRAKYRPFGGLVSVTGPASLDARFPGQWFQLESGLSYNWHRYYDATLGRYTQPDPLGWIAGPSLYAYADGNPVSGADPAGLAPKDKTYGLPRGFWNWYHRQVKQPGDPDLSREEAVELYGEWCDSGKPDPEGHRTEPEPEPGHQRGITDGDPWFPLFSPPVDPVPIPIQPVVPVGPMEPLLVP